MTTSEQRQKIIKFALYEAINVNNAIMYENKENFSESQKAIISDAITFWEIEYTGNLVAEDMAKELLKNSRVSPLAFKFYNRNLLLANAYLNILSIINEVQ